MEASVPPHPNGDVFVVIEIGIGTDMLPHLLLPCAAVNSDSTHLPTKPLPPSLRLARQWYRLVVVEQYRMIQSSIKYQIFILFNRISLVFFRPLQGFLPHNLALQKIECQRRIFIPRPSPMFEPFIYPQHDAYPFLGLKLENKAMYRVHMWTLKTDSTTEDA